MLSEPSDDGFEIEARVRSRGPTGVEMEALTAVAVCALTVYDMVKAADKTMVIENIRVMEKKGGKSGEYVRKDDEPENRPRKEQPAGIRAAGPGGPHLPARGARGSERPEEGREYKECQIRSCLDGREEERPSRRSPARPRRRRRGRASPERPLPSFLRAPRSPRSP